LFTNISLLSQEIRLYGGVQFQDHVHGGFNGAGIGIENPLSKRFSFNTDVLFGFQAVGSTVEVKTGVHLYFNDDQNGFFIGPALKYTTLKERNDRNLYDDSLFAAGFTVGVKTTFLDRATIVSSVSPHHTIGGSVIGAGARLSAQIGIGFRL